MAQGCIDPGMQVALVKMQGMSEDMAEIKTTMKELASAVQRLAVIEEKQTGLKSDIERALSEITKVGDRVTVLEQDRPLQKQSSDFVQTAVKYIVAAALGGLLSGIIRVPPSHPLESPPAVSGK